MERAYISKNIRIIPRLDIKGPNLVKGIHLEGLRVLGRPELFAPRYYADSADEIMYIDSVASLYGRNNLESIVRMAAKEIFIPLTVGGGIRTINDIHGLLRSGADKVAINTAVIENPSFIPEAVRVFGSQCIVIEIQAKSRGNGKYECLTHNAREVTGRDVFEWVKTVEELGAGEIMLTSVDRDGTGKGYDIDLIHKVTEMVNIPVIVSGGAGNEEHIKEAIVKGRVDAVSAASIFHYALLHLGKEAEYKEEGNIEFLRGNLPLDTFSRKCIVPVSILSLKKYLVQQGINVRVVN